MRNKFVIQLQLIELIKKYPKNDLLPSPQIIKQSAVIITDPQKLSKTLNFFLQGSLNMNIENHKNEPATPKVLSLIKSLLTAQ